MLTNYIYKTNIFGYECQTIYLFDSPSLQSLWFYQFSILYIACSILKETSGAEVEEHERQKEKVKILIDQTPDDSTYKIQLIDAIQRLGVGYHFQNEIHESFKYIHDKQLINNDDDLRVLALRFRLLRQHGYHVPCGNYIDIEIFFQDYN